jgi:hypothetical protein
MTCFFLSNFLHTLTFWVMVMLQNFQNITYNLQLKGADQK